MALIITAATVLGALATVLGVVLTVRGQRRSASKPMGVERSRSYYLSTRLDASHLKPITIETPDNLFVVDRAGYKISVDENLWGSRTPREIKRVVNQITINGIVVTDMSSSEAVVIDEVHKVQAAVHAAAQSSRSVRLRARWSPGRSRAAVTASVPSWATGLMSAEDAHRYAWEWGAHLAQLIEEGELKQAKRDRRVLALTAVFLAVALRARRVLSRVS